MECLMACGETEKGKTYKTTEFLTKKSGLKIRESIHQHLYFYPDGGD